MGKAAQHSAYTLYVLEQKDAVQAAHPAAGWYAVQTLIGDAWRKLPDDAKAQYAARARALKEQAPTPPPEAEEEFAVERIVASRVVDGRAQYLVRWEGYGDLPTTRGRRRRRSRRRPPSRRGSKRTSRPPPRARASPPPPTDWSLVGRRVEVLVDGSWTAGRVTNFDPLVGKHTIQYAPPLCCTSSTSRSRASAGASRPPRRPRRPPSSRCTTACALHLSAAQPGPGYLGVRRDGHRFRAVHDGARIGNFGTAVEAAVAFARHVLGMPVEAEAMEEDDEPVAEFDGVALHLSERSSTGYMGVERIGASFRARLGGTHIGTFDTAVEAAVAYARYARTRATRASPAVASLRCTTACASTSARAIRRATWA